MERHGEPAIDELPMVKRHGNETTKSLLALETYAKPTFSLGAKMYFIQVQNEV